MIERILILGLTVLFLVFLSSIIPPEPPLFQGGAKILLLCVTIGIAAIILLRGALDSVQTPDSES